jgi:type I restriction enzyme, R subunit
MTTDTSEKGLESLIVRAMAGQSAVAGADRGGGGHEPSMGTGWIAGDQKDYYRDYAIDLTQLRTFLPRRAVVVEV